jgi:hypothetical protein
MNHTTMSEMSENDVLVFRAQVWQRLPIASPEDVRSGSVEFLHTVAPIIDSLPSARRHEMSTQDTVGWQGGKTVSTVVLSREDAARVPSLLRAWQQGE